MPHVNVFSDFSLPLALSPYEAAALDARATAVGLTAAEFARKTLVGAIQEGIRGVRPVIVGLCPDVQGVAPFHGGSGSGRGLARLADVEPLELPRVFELVHLSERVGATRADLRKGGKLIRLGPSRAVIVCGTEALRALGRRALGPKGRTPTWARWYTCREGGKVALIPHPSGRNRSLNDADTRARTEKLLREARFGVGP
jgi:hypothetical protein